jgi:hypothetical protein
MITKKRDKRSPIKNKPVQCEPLRRGDAVDEIVPKLLGVLWDRGQIETITRSKLGKFQCGFVLVHLSRSLIEVGGRPLGHGIYQLAIWSEFKKVLSVYVVADRHDPSTPAYSVNRRFIISCKRGDWEDPGFAPGLFLSLHASVPHARREGAKAIALTNSVLASFKNAIASAVASTPWRGWPGWKSSEVS